MGRWALWRRLRAGHWEYTITNGGRSTWARVAACRRGQPIAFARLIHCEAWCRK